MNGSGSGWVWLSTLTLPSLMASSKALCVFGVVRLISSARTTLANIGPGRNSKVWSGLVENRHAQDVGGEQVAGELDAAEGAVEHARERMRQGGFSHPRHILDQEVALAREADQRQLDGSRLSADDRFDRLLQLPDFLSCVSTDQT